MHLSIDILHFFGNLGRKQENGIFDSLPPGKVHTEFTDFKAQKMDIVVCPSFQRPLRPIQSIRLIQIVSSLMLLVEHIHHLWIIIAIRRSNNEVRPQIRIDLSLYGIPCGH